MNTLIDIKHFHLFCGLGGGAKGFNKGQARVGSLEARFRCIGGIDVDPASIRDFTRASGAQGTVLDLFDTAQYLAFHGRKPPEGWREASIDDIRRAAGGEFPNIVFLSAPCKGFSGLLAEAQSKTDKYQALNGLTLRGVWLMLEAFKDDLPEFVVFENVPRIANRGRHLLDQIVALLRNYGYAVSETTHDCGELGGLGQSRKRFLLVARNAVKIPAKLYVHEPEKKRLRGVGEILERLPLPGDPRGGVMHRMPALQWKTWVRLAFVEAGSDWRSLNKLSVAEGVLTDFGIMPDYALQNGALGVSGWDQATGVITSRGLPTNGKFAVADPRPIEELNGSSYGVKRMADPAGVVTSQRSPGQGAFSVADPRIDGHEKSVQHGVRKWDETAGVVTGKMFVGGGPNSVADPRFEGKPHFNNVFRIVRWADAAGAVTAGHGPSSGGQAVADPRFDWNENAHGSKLAVQGWDDAARTISGARFGSGGGAVADPRPPERENYKTTKYRVTSMEESSGAVIAASTTGNGAFAVADPRPLKEPHGGNTGVHRWDESTGTIQGKSLPSNGAFAVADPRTGLDPQREAYQTGGHYGVVPWDETSRAVPGFAKHDRGPFSVADPRDGSSIPFSLTDDVNPAISLPKADDRLVCIIRALDNTWHRPFTTLELAALQSLVDPDEVGDWALDGQSDAAWRERIGNAVPPDAAAAIAGVFGTTLLLALSGETFVLNAQPVWVQPVAMALAIDHTPNDHLLQGD